MATQVYAYKSSTGKLFMSEREADTDEIRAAADVLAGVEANHLINVATGASDCTTTKNAIRLLAAHILNIPAAVAPGR